MPPSERTLVVRLYNAECQNLKNITTKFRFRKNGNALPKSFQGDFSKGLEVLPVPNVSDGAVDCLVTADRYEQRSTGFLPFRRQKIERDVWLPRDFRAGWNVQFAKWARLGPGFKPLKELLHRSPDLKLRDKETREFRPLGKFVASTYDNLMADDQVMRDAKCGMLNTVAKMLAVRMPCRTGKSWFDGIETALFIQRDRIVGIASPGLHNWVKNLHENAPWGFHPNYKRAGAGLHRKNIPEEYKIDRLYSVKTTDRIGVLQLTIAEVKDQQGKSRAILDADIDENGNLLKHFGDWIGHQFNGGTHPYHVYDLLHRTLEEPLIGYKLV